MQKQLSDEFVRQGVDCIQKNQYEIAQGLFKKALEMNPSSADALNNLGISCAKQGNIELSLEYFKKSFLINMRSAVLVNNLLLTLTQLGNIELASRVHNIFVSLGGNPSEIIPINRLIQVETEPYRTRWINTLSIFEIENKFQFSEKTIYPDESLFKSLAHWKMETDDSPIFRYLYRNFKPKRHLEFGTWQGAGVVYCLEECDATVWTINLPFGENQENGDSAYSGNGDSFGLGTSMSSEWARKIGLPPQEKYRSDSFGFIGRFYLEKGLGHRVNQIYCDTTQWDISNYPKGFFDSVLIDGGHTPEIVASDTRKALELVRPGGLIMWHDFCPPVRDKFEVVQGVMDGIEQCRELIEQNVHQLFWINPSWILVGIRK